MIALLRYTLDPARRRRGARRGRARPAARADGARLAAGGRGGAGIACGRRATRLALRYANAFPIAYRATGVPEEAALDILRIANLKSAGDRSVRICPHPSRKGEYRIKLYRLGGALALSEAVPVFENFGFRVIDEVPTRLDGTNGAFIHDFEITLTGGRSPTLDRDPALVEDAIAAVLEGVAENDAFNRLIVEAGMRPASVVLFRAWFRYLRQTGMNYGLATVVDALRRAPAVAAALIERFRRGARSRARGQGRYGDRSRRAGDRRGARRGLRDRRRPHPAHDPRRGAGDAAHQRLRARRRRGARVQDGQRQGPRPAPAVAVARDLGL